MTFKPNSYTYIKILNVDVYVEFFSYNPKNPTALILHGSRADTQRLLPFVNLLEHKYNIISFDFPGFGKSKSGVIKGVIKGNYIEYCAEVLDLVIKELQLIPQETTIFGISQGANTIIQYLLQYPTQSFLKCGFMGPIYSYKYLSMKPTYKRFVYWLTSTLKKDGFVNKIFQGAINSKRFFTVLMILFDWECLTNKSVREYERSQWQLMTTQHWGSTLLDFLSIDLSKITTVLPSKNTTFVFPIKDQYLDIDSTVEGFKKLCPEATFSYFKAQKHIPRGNFVENKEFMESVREIVESLYK
jgi:pimeloyl-ACP methyl ester carboxylesterase